MGNYFYASRETVLVRLSNRQIGLLESVHLSEDIGDCACSPVPEQEGEAEMNQTEEIEFVNRAYELDTICNPGGPALIVIDAPAGYGKTYLLRKAKQWYQEKAHKWKRAYFDLSAEANVTPQGVIAAITRQVIGQAYETVETLAAGVSRQGDPVILFIDSCEKNIEITEYLRDQAIPELIRRLKVPGIHLRVIFAGRYITRRPDWNWPGYKTIPLTPFDEVSVQELLVKLAGGGTEPAGIDIFVREVLFLSGGHPAVIRCMADYIVEQGWTVLWEQDRGKLFNNCVKDKEIVEQIFREASDEVKRALVTLSIFRRFTLNTIRELEARGKLEKVGDALAFLHNLLNTGLVQPPSTGNPFYSDAIVRDLILVEMRLKQPKQYHDLNHTAYQIYEKWIRGEGMEARITDQLLVTFIIEAFYHYLESREDISWAEVRSALTQYFGPAYLKSAFGDDFLPELKLLLGNALKEDKDIRRRLEEIGQYSQTVPLINQLAGVKHG